MPATTTTTTTPLINQPNNPDYQYTYVIHSTAPLAGLDNIHNQTVQPTPSNTGCLFNLHIFQFVVFLIPCLLGYLTYTRVLFHNGYSEYIGDMGFGSVYIYFISTMGVMSFFLQPSY
eukprot:UN10016